MRCKGKTKAGKRCKKKCGDNDFCHLHINQTYKLEDMIDIFSNLPNDLKGIVKTYYWKEQYNKVVKMIWIGYLVRRNRITEKLRIKYSEFCKWRDLEQQSLNSNNIEDFIQYSSYREKAQDEVRRLYHLVG